MELARNVRSYTLQGGTHGVGNIMSSLYQKTFPIVKAAINRTLRDPFCDDAARKPVRHKAQRQQSREGVQRKRKQPALQQAAPIVKKQKQIKKHKPKNRRKHKSNPELPDIF